MENMTAETGRIGDTSKVRFGDVDDLHSIEHGSQKTPQTEDPQSGELGTVYQRLGKSKLALAIAHSTDRLLHSDANENKKVKAILGVIGGIIFGIFLFLILKFSFGYTYLQSSIIALISTIILCIGLALFPMCRCIVALMFPNMFTQKGRAVLLSVIFGILINYQISNITYNARVTGDSMSCVVELAAEQARDIQAQLAVPVQEMANYMNNQVSELKQSTQGIQTAFSKADEALKTADKSLNEAKTFVDNIIKTCDEQIKAVRDACNAVCNDFIGPVSCDVCRKLGCDNLSVIKNGITTINNSTRGAVDDILQYFNVEMKVTTDLSGTTTTTANTTAIREQVNEEITSKTDIIEILLEIMKKILSVSLFLVLVQAYWYLRNYLAKDGYDNIYITSQFRKLDQEQSSGGEQLLPLKKKEKREYVDTHSLRLNSIELVHCEIGLVQVGLHFLVFLLLTMFDYALYYILSLIQKYGSVNVIVEGQGRFEVSIKGKGPVADFYRIMIKNLNEEHTMNSTLDVQGCLPNPQEPDAGIVPGILIMYVVAVLMVLLRGYGMRLRRKISAYYYPQQEEVRIEFLHKKIRHKRIGFLKFLRQQIMSSHKENTVKEQLRFSTWISFKCPMLARCLPETIKVECTCCEQKESRLNHVTLTSCSGTVGGVRCKAVYCQECWSNLKNECPLCCVNSVEMRL